jgi:antitoxin component YwqK of YwqJK toxin-antitoxin module
MNGQRTTAEARTPMTDEIETTHYANGKVKHRGAHRDGEMHGPWEFYRLDGSLMRAGSFDRGRQVGTWRTFDRAGNVVKETTFE